MVQNATPTVSSGAFDLNIERVLDHWEVPFALREILANALDESALTETGDPQIYADPDGTWHIRDYGSGLRYEHLTQKENPAKHKHPGVIGQFGMGLKDALATFDRRGVEVSLHSRFGDITTQRRPKSGFPDIQTLHAILTPPADPDMVGTDVVLARVEETDVVKAKSFFLRFSDDKVLETTRYGQVLAHGRGSSRGRIYVKGLLVAEEPKFLFSYNVTNLTAALRRALNRERSNVGRTAYGDRVKGILIECTTTAVAEPLTADLAEFGTGRQHDELAWTDVALHACSVLAANEKVVFVTDEQRYEGGAVLEHARDDGYRLVTVPGTVARRLGKLADSNGKPVLDLEGYAERWNSGFTYAFIEPNDLRADERAVFELARPLFGLVGTRLGSGRVRTLAISETMRLPTGGDGVDRVHGVWQPDERRIIVRRDQLASPEEFAGTLLHEIGHALSGEGDVNREFELELSRLLGITGVRALGAEGLVQAEETTQADR